MLTLANYVRYSCTQKIRKVCKGNQYLCEVSSVWHSPIRNKLRGGRGGGEGAKRNFLETLGNRIQANPIVVADIAITIKSGRRSLARCFFSYPFISLYCIRKILKNVCPVNQVIINSSLNQAYATIMVIIFKEFLMFYQISLSPKLNRNVIISNKHGMQQVPPKLQTTSDLRS